MPAGMHLCVYHCVLFQLAAATAVPTDSTAYGTFRRAPQLVDNVPQPGATWAERNASTYTITWPQPRAGHAGQNNSHVCSGTWT
jgi:hypothetical protein